MASLEGYERQVYQFQVLILEFKWEKVAGYFMQ